MCLQPSVRLCLHLHNGHLYSLIPFLLPEITLLSPFEEFWNNGQKKSAHDSDRDERAVTAGHEVTFMCYFLLVMSVIKSCVFNIFSYLLSVTQTCFQMSVVWVKMSFTISLAAHGVTRTKLQRKIIQFLLESTDSLRASIKGFKLTVDGSQPVSVFQEQKLNTL